MNNARKTFISLIVFAGVVALVLIFGVYPLWKGVKTNSRQFLFTKTDIYLLVSQEEQQREVQQAYQKHQLDLGRVDSIFIDPDVPLELISFLELQANNSQVVLEISSITKKEEKQDPWPSLLIQLTAKGSLPGFLRYLERLEAGPYLIEVLDLTVRTARDLPDQDEISANLSLKVFSK